MSDADIGHKTFKGEAHRVYKGKLPVTNHTSLAFEVFKDDSHVGVWFKPETDLPISPQGIMLDAGDLLSLLSVLKEQVIDPELEIQKRACDEMIAKYAELKKSIVSDARDIADMAIHATTFEFANMLVCGGKKVIEIPLDEDTK